jgi:hypothetical protein
MNIFAESVDEVLERQMVAYCSTTHSLEVSEECVNLMIHCVGNVSLDKPAELSAVHPLMYLVHAKLIEHSLQLHLAGHDDIADLALQIRNYK